MHLSRIESLFGDITVSEDSNVLGNFPPNTFHTILTDVTQMLLTTGQSHQILTTEAHIDWVLKVLGNGFNLPIVDYSQLEDCCKIYSNWLLNPDSRPVYFKKHRQLKLDEGIQDSARQSIQELSIIPIENYEVFEQKFYQTIILHISQVYSLRLLPSPVDDTKLWNLMLGLDPTPSETFETLILNNEVNYNDVIHHFLDLHRDVISLFVKVGTHLSDVMSEETWDILLKTILGITDHLVYIHSRLSALSQTLGNDKVENYRRIILKITSVITDTQLRAFFEIWFRSQNQSIMLWNTFQQRFNVWCMQSNVVQHWNAMTLSFTKKLSSILVQNNTAKSQLVVFSTHGYSFKVNFSYEYLLFAWYKTVNLIHDPNTIPAQSYVHALRGISKLISVLEQSSANQHQSKAIVDGSTLIRLFGRWLFNLNEEQLTLSEFSEARCMIYGTMCQLFSTQPVETFHEHYQNHFYKSIIEGLSHFDTMQSILMHSDKLMNNQPTVAVRLLPHFVKSFQSIVPTLSPSCKLIFPLDVLRKSILDIITSTICLPDLCKSYTLPKDWASNRPTSPMLSNSLRKFIAHTTNDNSFSCIKIYILNVLLHFLSSEANGDNLILTLHLIDVYLIHETSSQAPELIRIAISNLSDQMLKFNLSEQVILGVFNLLNNLLERLPIDGVANQEILQEVVSSICKFIDRSLSMGDVGFTRRLIITAYFTLDRWVSQGIWITTEDNTDYASDVFKILHRGINYTPPVELLPSSPTHPRVAQSVQIQSSPSRHLPNTHKSQSVQHPGLPQGLDSFANPADKFNPLEVSKEINNIAELVLYRFLNLFNESTCTMSQLGSFLPCDPDFDDISFSKLILERKTELANDSKNKDISEYELDVPLCRHYLFEKKVLITVVEPLPSAFTMNDPEFSIKKSSPKQSPFIIVRSSFGKLCWSVKPWGDGGRVMFQKSIHEAPNPTPIESTPFDVPNKIPSMPDISHHSTHSTTDVTNEQEGENHSTEDRKANMDESLSEIIKSQIEQEKYVNSKNLPAHHDFRGHSTLPGLTEAYKAHLYFNLARKFLIQFGFINIDNQNKLIPLTMTQKLIRDVETLDKTSTLTPITASVFYCTSSTQTFSDLIFPSSEISPIFKELLYSLGKPVDLSAHRGFSGQLNPQICSVSPYFRDSSVELMFHCPALLKFPGASATSSPSNDKVELNSKRGGYIHSSKNSTDSFGMEANDYRLIMRNDQVFLIWMDTDATGTIPSHHDRSHSRSPSASPNSNLVNIQPSVVDLIGKADATYIIVTPINNLPNTDLFQVNIVLPHQANKNMSHIVSSPSQNPFMDFPSAPNITPTGFPGPLIDGMVIRRDALGSLLRNTVISSHMDWLNCRSNNADQQFTTRSRILKQLNNTSSPVNNIKAFNSYCMKLVQTPLNTLKPDI